VAVLSQFNGGNHGPSPDCT